MRLLVVPLVAAGFAFALVTAATSLVKRPSQAAAVKPTAIVWADRVFANRHQFDVWLRSRGSSYKVWAARHPALVEPLGPSPRPAALGPRQPRRHLAADEPQSTGRDSLVLPIGGLVTAAAGLLCLFVVVRTRRKPWAPRKVVLPSVRFRFPSRPAAIVPKRALKAKGFVFAGIAAQSVLAARRDLGTRLENRVRRPRALNMGEETLRAIDRVPIRYVLRKSLPDLALYATAILLACALGASIAIYLS